MEDKCGQLLNSKIDCGLSPDLRDMLTERYQYNL